MAHSSPPPGIFHFFFWFQGSSNREPSLFKLFAGSVITLLSSFLAISSFDSVIQCQPKAIYEKSSLGTVESILLLCAQVANSSPALIAYFILSLAIILWAIPRRSSRWTLGVFAFVLSSFSKMYSLDFIRRHPTRL